eukprot:g32734.t1
MCMQAGHRHLTHRKVKSSMAGILGAGVRRTAWALVSSCLAAWQHEARHSRIGRRLQRRRENCWHLWELLDGRDRLHAILGDWLLLWRCSLWESRSHTFASELQILAGLLQESTITCRELRTQLLTLRGNSSRLNRAALWATLVAWQRAVAAERGEGRGSHRSAMGSLAPSSLASFQRGGARPLSVSEQRLRTKMNVPLAQAAAVPNQFAVVVPNGVSPGQLIQATTPDGQQVQVPVPAGCTAGSQFMVSYQPKPVPAMPVMAMPVAAPAQHAMGMPGAPGMGGVAQLHYWPGASDPFAILDTLAGDREWSWKPHQRLSSSVSIKQQINWAEVLVGWDQPEKYLISDPLSGRDLFVAAERSDGLMGMVGRQVFEGGSRPFNLDIALLTGPGNAPQPFVRLERPFACTCLCFGRPRMHIYNALTNQLIASTVEPIIPALHTDREETNFEVFDGGQVVGNIRRQFNTAQALGAITGVNADSDQFHVDFKEVQSPQWKAALIAMALFLDYCYFVKGGQTARRESALGRAIQVERRWNDN